MNKTVFFVDIAGHIRKLHHTLKRENLIPKNHGNGKKKQVIG
jgi:hypothetical protein